ncbi:19227_t:CDS:2, partial [Cetraspora pellucida]
QKGLLLGNSHTEEAKSKIPAAKQGQLRVNSHTTESRAIMAAVNAKQVLCYELTTEGPPKPRGQIFSEAPGETDLLCPGMLSYPRAVGPPVGKSLDVKPSTISRRIKHGTIFEFNGRRDIGSSAGNQSSRYRELKRDYREPRRLYEINQVSIDAILIDMSQEVSISERKKAKIRGTPVLPLLCLLCLLPYQGAKPPLHTNHANEKECRLSFDGSKLPRGASKEPGIPVKRLGHLSDFLGYCRCLISNVVCSHLPY